MATALHGEDAVLPLIPSSEETMLRDAVAGICSGFGHEYSRRKHAAGEPPTELWEALAEKGYLGVNLPDEWGGEGSACRAWPRSGRRSPQPEARCC
jgi:alkylation response protein AidB-like acyl-CoA dehydrogenase